MKSAVIWDLDQVLSHNLQDASIELLQQEVSSQLQKVGKAQAKMKMKMRIGCYTTDDWWQITWQITTCLTLAQGAFPWANFLSHNDWFKCIGLVQEQICEVAKVGMPLAQLVAHHFIASSTLSHLASWLDWGTEGKRCLDNPLFDSSIPVFTDSGSTIDAV